MRNKLSSIYSCTKLLHHVFCYGAFAPNKNYARWNRELAIRIEECSTECECSPWKMWKLFYSFIWLRVVSYLFRRYIGARCRHKCEPFVRRTRESKWFNENIYIAMGLQCVKDECAADEDRAIQAIRFFIARRLRSNSFAFFFFILIAVHWVIYISKFERNGWPSIIRVFISNRKLFLEFNFDGCLSNDELIFQLVPTLANDSSINYSVAVYPFVQASKRLCQRHRYGG